MVITQKRLAAKNQMRKQIKQSNDLKALIMFQRYRDFLLSLRISRMSRNQNWN